MELNAHIEAYNLSPTVTGAGVDRLVDFGAAKQLYSVCIPPFWVKRAAREIGERQINLSTIIGYPYGYQMTESKLEEGRLAIRDGADELLLTINHSAIRDESNWPKIEVAKFSSLCHENQKLLTVSLDISLLHDGEFQVAALQCADAGADFVNMSNGISGESIDVQTITDLRDLLPERIGIKVTSGRVKIDAVQYSINAGANFVRLSSLRD